MSTRLVVSLALALSIAGCGAQPESSDKPDICATNPISASCGGPSELVQSALLGNYTTGVLAKEWGSYRCNPIELLPWRMIGESALGFTNAGDMAITFFEADVINRIGLLTMVTPTVVKLTEAMDGPYHVIYNTAQANAFINDVHDTQPVLPHTGFIQVTIPPYGIWIYARGERTDYPNGVMVVTFDSIVPNPDNGICGGRQQFVVGM